MEVAFSLRGDFQEAMIIEIATLFYEAFGVGESV
jgi:hypothetical protein